MYGAQAPVPCLASSRQFENDVEMYGAQAKLFPKDARCLFENDVEMYGAQATSRCGHP